VHLVNVVVQEAASRCDYSPAFYGLIRRWNIGEQSHLDADHKLLCFLSTCNSLCYTTWAQDQHTHLKQTLPYYFLSLRSRCTLIALYWNMFNKCFSLKETVFSTRRRDRLWCPPTIRIKGVIPPEKSGLNVKLITFIQWQG